MAEVVALRRTVVSVEFLSGEHRISCEISTRDNPLIDTLNERLSQFITAENVYVSPIDDPTIFLAQRPHAVLRKDQISVAILRREEDGYARSVLHRNLRQVPIVFALTAILSDFEIRGGLKATTASEADILMAQGTDRFVATYYATARLNTDHEMQFAGGAILINREHARVLFVERK